MKRHLLSSLLLVVILAGANPGARREEPAPMLVTADWVASHVQDPALVLLHVGDRKEFDQGHLPGARYLDRAAISAPRVEGSLALELPPVAQLVEAFESLGVSGTSRIVLYFGGDWVTPTTRAYFVLDYLGLGGRTSILDGGMAAWVAAGRPVTSELAAPARGRITPKPRPEIVADAEFLKANLATPSVAVVDSRLLQFYEGREKGMMPRAGRIPGARSIPFSSLAGDDNRLKGKAELKRLFAAAGVPDTATVVTYCHIGQQASLGYFVARYLGYPARLYDGSFEEWSRRPELPVDTGAPSGK